MKINLHFPMKKIIKFFILIICISMLLGSKSNCVVNADTNLTTAKSMVVIESNSHRILCEKDCNIKLPMASTTKITTALTVLNNCKNINEIVDISNNSVGIEGTSIYLKKGERLTVLELLYGLILASGNDASVALAMHTGGTIQNFAKMMNKTAYDCGAKNTNYINPHGLDAEGHYTTAYDLAIITAEALKNKIFREIIATQNIKITGSTENSYRYLKNKNKLLLQYDGCTGVKTGFTDNAGRCFVGSARKNNMEIISVVFNCGPMFEETAQLFDFVFNEYENKELLPPYCYQRKIKVIDGKEKEVKLYTKKQFVYPLNKDEYNKILYEINIPDKLKAPIVKERAIGELNIYLDNCLLFSTKIYTMDSVKSDSLKSSLKEIISIWNKGKNENK